MVRAERALRAALIGLLALFTIILLLLFAVSAVAANDVNKRAASPWAGVSGDAAIKRNIGSHEVCDEH